MVKPRWSTTNSLIFNTKSQDFFVTTYGKYDVYFARRERLFILLCGDTRTVFQDDPTWDAVFSAASPTEEEKRLFALAALTHK